VVEQVTSFFAERFKLVRVHLDGEVWELTTPLRTYVSAGSTIRCTLDTEGLLFFDTRTGVRIG
jgi:hypothetical protein